MATKTYKFFEDPGHGWARVPLADLRTLGVAHRISRCSYTDSTYAYLEEDCDLATFMHFAKKAGWNVLLAEATFVKDFSRKRLAPYPQSAAYSYEENVRDVYRTADFQA